MFLATAEVVDHDRERAMLECLRQLEMQRPTVDATAVVLADDDDYDKENPSKDDATSSQGA